MKQVDLDKTEYRKPLLVRAGSKRLFVFMLAIWIFGGIFVPKEPLYFWLFGIFGVILGAGLVGTFPHYFLSEDD